MTATAIELFLPQIVTWVACVASLFSPYSWIRHIAVMTFNIIQCSMLQSVLQFAFLGTTSNMTRLFPYNSGAYHIGNESTLINGLVFGAYFSYLEALGFSILWTFRICFFPTTHLDSILPFLESYSFWPIEIFYVVLAVFYGLLWTCCDLTSHEKMSIANAVDYLVYGLVIVGGLSLMIVV